MQGVLSLLVECRVAIRLVDEALGAVRLVQVDVEGELFSLEVDRGSHRPIKTLKEIDLFTH